MITRMSRPDRFLVGMVALGVWANLIYLVVRPTQLHARSDNTMNVRVVGGTLDREQVMSVRVVGGRLDYETDITSGPTLKVCTSC